MVFIVLICSWRCKGLSVIKLQRSIGLILRAYDSLTDHAIFSTEILQVHLQRILSTWQCQRMLRARKQEFAISYEAHEHDGTTMKKTVSSESVAARSWCSLFTPLDIRFIIAYQVGPLLRPNLLMAQSCKQCKNLICFRDNFLRKVFGGSGRSVCHHFRKRIAGSSDWRAFNVHM